MYYALTNGKKLPTERLQWVKLQDNGVYVLCSEAEGQGIIINGEIYHVDGRPEIDKPTVDIIWEDDVLRLSESTAELEEFVIDQEYRFILLGLGVM